MTARAKRYLELAERWAIVDQRENDAMLAELDALWYQMTLSEQDAVEAVLIAARPPVAP
jgi:hypothetical protein